MRLLSLDEPPQRTNVLAEPDRVRADEALAGRRDVTVVPALLGNDAGVVGAAALAFDRVFLLAGVELG